MKKLFSKRVFSCLLVLIMVAGMIYHIKLTTQAASPTSITIDNITLQSGQYLPRGATYVVTTKPDGGYAYYNNGVLTLDGFSYWCRSGNDVIHADGDLTITLIGTNGLYIDESYTSNGNCIDVAGNLTINGSGPLTLSSRSYNAITVSGNLNFNHNGKVTVTSNYGAAVYCNGAVTINGNLSVTSVDNGMGIFSKNTLTMNSGTVSVSADAAGTYAAIESSAGGVNINGGNLTVNSTYHGIEILNAFCQRGGTVTVTSTEGSGIVVNNATSNAVIYAGTLSVTGNRYGIQAQRFYTYGGHGFIYSDNTAHDSTYCAVDVTDGYVKASHITAKASTTTTGANQKDVVAADLGTYDYIHFYAKIQLSGYTITDNMYFQFASTSPSVSNTKPTTGGYAYYKDNTLTLHNYIGVANANGITHNYDLTIVLDSGTTNSITTSTTDSSCEGIYVQGSLTIKGSGTLNLYQGGYAVYSTGNLTVNSATLDCKNSGLYSGANMTLTNAKITVGQLGTLPRLKYAIQAVGSISISGSSTSINVNSPDLVNSTIVNGICGKGITISAGNIQIYASGYAIESTANLTVTGGSIILTGGRYGIYATNMTVSGGGLTVFGGTDGIYVNKLNVTSGSIRAYSENTSSDGAYCAIKIISDYDTGFVINRKLSVIANTDPEEQYSTALNINNLHNYDYIRIGSFVMLHDVVLPSGYYMESGNSVTKVSTSKPSSGKYAYYYNGVLKLYNYSYSGSSVAIRTFTDTNIYSEGGSEINHIISHKGYLVFDSGVLHIKANLGNAAINTNGDVFFDSGSRITIESGYAGIYCENFYLRGGLAWVTANYHGINFNSGFTVTGGAITIKSTNTSGDSSYRAIHCRGSAPTVNISNMNHMVGKTSSPDILESTNFTSYDYDFAAIGEFVMVRGVILYKGCYLFNGDSQPYQNVGSHTEYAYLKDKNTLELKGYQYSGSAYGIASNIDLTIVLYDEENSIEAKGDYDAIHCNANLTVKGGTNYNDGITVKAANGFGIYAENTFTIDSDNVIVSSSDYPVSVGEFIINKGGRLKATCTYTGSTYTLAALAAGSATINGGRIDLFAATNRGNALEVDNNLVIKGGTVILNSPKGDGIYISDGTMTVQGGDIDITAGSDGIYLYNGSYLSIQGGEIDITATQNGIWLYSGRLNMNGGFLTVASTATTDDSSYRAIRLNGTSSDYYNVASTLRQTASVNGTGTGIVDLVPADLSTYDFVVIGDYIWIGHQKLPSGYSFSPDGTIVEGNKGAGYAYYSKGTLTLNGFHYTSSSSRGIFSYKNLTISVIGNSSILTNDYLSIDAYGNLTFVGSRTLTLDCIRSYGNVSIADTNLVIDAPLDIGICAEKGSVTLSSGSLKIISYDEGITAKSMTVSGGELHIVSKGGNGIYLSEGKFTMTGGFATIICTCDNIETSISAIRLEAGSSYYNVSANLTQAASIFYTWENVVKLIPEDLNNYDYVVIGDFVDIGGVIVQSGYSVNADGTVFKGNKGTGYAYYYNGTLTLDGFTYNGDSNGILAIADLTLQLKNANKLEVTGDYYGIEAYGDLTITGNGSLSVVAENDGVIMRTANCQLVINSDQLTITSGDSGILCNNGEVIINGGTLIITAVDDGIDAGFNSGIVTINGGTIDVTASQYAILMNSFIINDGKLSAKSTDSSVFNDPDIQWSEDMLVLVSDSLDESQLAPLAPNKLPTGKKYVKIENNNYVEIDGNRVYSGYSIDKNGNIIKGNGGSGYAYYYKGTLTLDGFTLTCENVAIYAHIDLILQLKNTNTLSVSGNVSGIDALANLTITGTGSLSVTAQDPVNATHAIRVANNFYMQSGTVQSEGFNALRMDRQNSQFVMDGGSLTLIGYGYFYMTDVTINGGSISVTNSCSTIDELIVNGGTLTAEGEYYAIVANSSTFNGGVTIAKAHNYYAIRSDDSFKLGENMVIWTSSSTSGTNLKVDDDNRITSDNKYVKITVCNHTDVTTDKDHNCDICGKEGVTDHTAVNTGYDDTYHWYICNCGQKITEKHTFTDGTCVCGKDIRGFTKQPVGGEVASGEKLTVTWATNFTPKKLQVLKYNQGYCTGTQTLDVNATTANVSAGDEYCTIRAYYSDSEYVVSDKFYVTEKEVDEPGLKGDVDLDGDVDMDDVVALMSHVLMDVIITDPTSLSNGEVTNDTTLNMDDVVKLMRYVLSDISTLD